MSLSTSVGSCVSRQREEWRSSSVVVCLEILADFVVLPLSLSLSAFIYSSIHLFIYLSFSFSMNVEILRASFRRTKRYALQISLFSCSPICKFGFINCNAYIIGVITWRADARKINISFSITSEHRFAMSAAVKRFNTLDKFLSKHPCTRNSRLLHARVAWNARMNLKPCAFQICRKVRVAQNINRFREIAKSRRTR